MQKLRRYLNRLDSQPIFRNFSGFLFINVYNTNLRFNLQIEKFPVYTSTFFNPDL